MSRLDAVFLNDLYSTFRNYNHYGTAVTGRTGIATTNSPSRYAGGNSAIKTEEKTDSRRYGYVRRQGKGGVTNFAACPNPTVLPSPKRSISMDYAPVTTTGHKRSAGGSYSRGAATGKTSRGRRCRSTKKAPK